MQVLFVSETPIGNVKEIEKECKLCIQKINKLENPVLFQAFRRAFHYGEKIVELKGGLFYYHVIGWKERLAAFAEKYGLNPDLDAQKTELYTF